MSEAKTALENNLKSDLEQMAKSFQKTFTVEKRLFKSELAINAAYCDSLFEAGVLTRPECEKIKNGLQTLLKRAEFDRDYFEKHESENISTFIEERLVQLVGKIGKKINIGRSLYDLSSSVLRYWLRDEITKISQGLRSIQKNLISYAKKNGEVIFFAHKKFQTTQPILFGHWCLAVFEMFARDRERLDEVWRRTNTLPLGSNRGNGTSFEIDREELARKLKFEGISSNSLDAVGDRDFILEFVNASNLIMTHILRLVEDFLFYSSEKIRFINFENRTSENLLETIRGRGVGLQGFQTTLNANMKGLPLGFHRDFTEQNEIVFETVDLITNSLKVFDAVLSNIQLNTEKLGKVERTLFVENSEIFDYFVHRNVSFEEAEIFSRKIVDFLKNKNFLSQISIDELREISPVIGKDIFEVFDIKRILKLKNQLGGTSPERVSEALSEAENKLKFEE